MVLNDDALSNTIRYGFALHSFTKVKKQQLILMRQRE